VGYVVDEKIKIQKTMGKINYWEKFEAGIFYHVYNRGINGENIFRSDENYAFFLRKWKLLIHPFFKTAAYCLMPNHFHFLVSPHSPTKAMETLIATQQTSKSQQYLKGSIGYNDFLEDQFKRLFSSYVLAFNKQHNRKGSLLQKRFKRVSMKTEYQLWHTLAYIHRNPMHHYFTEDYMDWKFSSYSAYLSDPPTALCRTEVLKWFGNSKKEQLKMFLELHNEYKEDLKHDYLEDSN